MCIRDSSARRATFDFILNCVVKIISIHALREEGDLADDVECQRRENISIHALREEGDSKNRDKISIFL